MIAVTHGINKCNEGCEKKPSVSNVRSIRRSGNPGHVSFSAYVLINNSRAVAATWTEWPIMIRYGNIEIV